MNDVQSYRKQALGMAARIHAATADLRLIPRRPCAPSSARLTRAIRSDRAIACSLVHLQASAMFAQESES